MTITLYGLKNCDTCKKALKALDVAGVAHTFVDIRAEADLAARVPAWLAAVGAARLINTRSTTWRGLSDADKARAGTDAAALLAAHPTLIKRPVVEADGETFVGWTEEITQKLGA
ncbi:MAG: ArsC/Spx/MgsR family protein [Pseudomonadota bacterium]